MKKLFFTFLFALTSFCIYAGGAKTSLDHSTNVNTPQKSPHQSTMSIADTTNSNTITVSVFTDYYASEISYEIIDANTEEVLYTLDGFSYYELSTNEYSLEDGCYRFIIHDTAGNGFSYGGFYEVKELIDGDIIAFNDGNFGSQEVIDFCLPFDLPAPIALFSFSETCDLAEVTETQNLSSTAATYQWLAPGASPEMSTEEAPTFTFPEGGSYTITLIASNSVGSDTTMQQVNIPDANKLEIEVGTDSLPASTSWQIVDQNTGEIVQERSDFIASDANEDILCLPDGCYTFTIFDAEGNGFACCDSYYFLRQIKPDGNEYIKTHIEGENFGAEESTDFCLPFTDVRANFITFPGPHCRDVELRTQFVGANAETFKWSTPGAIPEKSAEKSPIFYFPESGTYTITLTVEGELGVDTHSEEIVIGDDYSVSMNVSNFNPVQAFSYQIVDQNTNEVVHELSADEVGSRSLENYCLPEGCYTLNLFEETGDDFCRISETFTTCGGYVASTGGVDIASGREVNFESSFDFCLPHTPLCGILNTESFSHSWDEDFCVDAVGFDTNEPIYFSDSDELPENALVSDVSLDLFFRLEGTACESEIDILFTDRAGGRHKVRAFQTCDGGSDLYSTTLSFPSFFVPEYTDAWLIQFDNANDGNEGCEYSVRFARLNYTVTTGGLNAVDQISESADMDISVDGTGFDNNPSVSFSDPGTPADAVLSDISLEVYFRLNGNSCENEIAMQLTDPAGNTKPLTAYTTCDGSTDLLFAELEVPGGLTTGTPGDWVLQFDDTNDQNPGAEYSVRFARLDYTTTIREEDEGAQLSNSLEPVSDYVDKDVLVDAVGFENNENYTFSDPGTPADAYLFASTLEVYFKLTGSSCENEIAMKLTSPSGNTQELTAYATCEGGTDLYYACLSVSNTFRTYTTGSPGDWVLEFDDTNDQNPGFEYSVRFARLTYYPSYNQCLPDESGQIAETPAQQMFDPTLSFSQLNVFPIPTSQELNLEYVSEYDAPTEVIILSNMGKALTSRKVSVYKGLNNLRFDVADLPAGHYYIRTSNEYDVQMKPFIKI